MNCTEQNKSHLCHDTGFPVPLRDNFHDNLSLTSKLSFISQNEWILFNSNINSDIVFSLTVS